MQETVEKDPALQQQLRTFLMSCVFCHSVCGVLNDMVNGDSTTLSARQKPHTSVSYSR